MKIAVIGHSGSGKSTLASKLGEKYNTPVLHMDTIYFSSGWQEREKSRRQDLVSSFMTQNRDWVIDGNYSGILMNERMARRDKILFMAYPRLVCFSRALGRYLKYKGKTRPSMAQECPEKFDIEFMRWILFGGRSKRKMEAYRKIALQYPEKFIKITSDKQLEKLMKSDF